MALGSLYPFARNHHEFGDFRQEPYQFPAYDYVLASSRAALQTRYAHLKYYYSLFVKLNGGTFK